MFRFSTMLLFGALLVPAAAHADIAEDIGYAKLKDVFNLAGQDCSKLDAEHEKALKDCDKYPSATFKTGCKRGVEKAYQEIQWTTCKPSSADCEQFGKEAADFIARGICNIKCGVEPHPNAQVCYEYAKTTCESSVLGIANSFVTAGDCMDDALNPVVTAFTIYDSHIKDGVKGCDPIVKQMLGMP